MKASNIVGRSILGVSSNLFYWGHMCDLPAMSGICSTHIQYSNNNKKKQTTKTCIDRRRVARIGSRKGEGDDNLHPYLEEDIEGANSY